MLLRAIYGRCTTRHYRLLRCYRFVHSPYVYYDKAFRQKWQLNNSELPVGILTNSRNGNQEKEDNLGIIVVKIIH